MELEAKDRDAAVAGFKKMMSKEAIEAHMKEKHPGQPVMSVKECHDMIEEQVQPAM